MVSDFSIYKHALVTEPIEKRRARMGRNPKTGVTIKIAAKTVVKFRVAKAAKDAVMGEK